MPTIDPKSFTNSVVPLVYIENITLSDSNLSDVELDTDFYVKSKNQFGSNEYNNTGLDLSKISQNQNGTGLQVSINTFLMLNKATYNFCNATDALEIVVALTSDERVINAMRTGRFGRFKNISNLAANNLVSLKTIPFKEYINFHRAKNVTIDEQDFTKLNFTTTMHSDDTTPTTLACFAFTRFSDNRVISKSFGGRKQLFGRIIGELIMDQGVVNNSTYFFKVAQDDSIWAGPVHQHLPEGSDRRIYMEGIKHIPD